MPLRARAALIVAAALLGALLLLTLGLRVARAGAVIPGVTVAGIELGGLDESAAAQRLSETLGATARTSFTVVAGDVTTQLSAEELGYELDVAATTDAAMAVGRGGNPVTQAWRQISAFWTAEEVAPVDGVDDDVLAAALADLGDRVDAAPFPGDLVPAGTSLEVVPPRDGVLLDRAAARTRLQAQMATRSLDDVELEVLPQPSAVDLDDLVTLAASVETALPDGVTLTGDGNELRLDGTEIGPLIGVDADHEGRLTLTIDPDGLAAVVGDRATPFEQEAVDASFDIPREPPVAFDAKNAATWEPIPVDVDIDPSRPGRVWDAEAGADQVAELLMTGRRSAPIRLVDVEAELTTEDAEDVGLTHLLGTFTTYHSCCQARVVNIQLLADMVDGTLVEPGEQFSINQISQVRTCTKGFRPAGMIFNGELIDSCGGGVSQFGTTTFNAAFFSGLQLDTWKAHSFYISRYPMGREATLNYPDPDIDVRFTNTTDHGLLVRTSHTPTSITVSIYGQSDIASVTSGRSEPYAGRSFGTIRRANAALPPGTEKQIQSGANGFSVTVTRVTEFLDGTEDEWEFVTTYLPKNVIIEYGPGEPAPQPSPSDSPSPQPSPSDSPSPQPSPSDSPSPQPSPSDSPSPQPSPSDSPSPGPSSSPEPEPSPTPTSEPDPEPSETPASEPSPEPT